MLEAILILTILNTVLVTKALFPSSRKEEAGKKTVPIRTINFRR